MAKIIQKLLTIFFVECFFYYIKIINNGNSKSSLKSVFINTVEAKPFRKVNIESGEIFYAEVEDDLKTRLYQILNNDIRYQRKPLEFLVEKNEKNPHHRRRGLFSVFSLNYEEKQNNNNSNSNNNDDNNDSRKSFHHNDISNDKASNGSNYTPGVSRDNSKHSNPKFPCSSNKSDEESYRTKSKSNLNSPSKNCFDPFRGNRVKPLSEFYHSINIEKEEEFFNTQNETSSSIPFNFIIECKDDEEKCFFINDKLEDAGKYISNIFNIYRTINVDVHILPFCRHMRDDNCAEINALTYSPSFVTLNITNQGYYSYPQALVKQFGISDRVKNYAKNDISLYFNTDYIKKYNYGNFLLVATHELIHGMGFFHLMTTASAAFKMNFPEDRIIPQPLVHNYRTSVGHEKAYEGWIPFTVFDRYIVEVSHPDYYIHQGIREYLDDVQVHKLISEEEVINHFENLSVSSDTHSFSKHLVTPFTTKKALGFRTYDGEVVTLQTFKEYEPMSSVSHIHAPFSCDSSFNCYIPKEKLNEVDENYIMYYSVITRSAHDLVDRFSSQSSHGFIGEKIIKIMKTIGWTEKQDKTYFKTFESFILSKEEKMSSASLVKPFTIIKSISIILFSISFLL
ncbi:hypothetical protein PIROE2DRAFT_14352 [Piromyces sp. E2]|nr:hypothetical protein PIROE2DRAFT_14352 [Piromyces sp. E2]|eukprot:OUM59976.1 hypothetical protein PIROE2DRAFT_14352 [Piromyces sp. E2]